MREIFTRREAGKIIILDDKKRDILDVCEGICHKKKKKAEVTSKNELIISIESFGQLDVKDMFKESIEVLKKDLASVTKAIDKAL